MELPLCTVVCRKQLSRFESRHFNHDATDSVSNSQRAKQVEGGVGEGDGSLEGVVRQVAEGQGVVRESERGKGRH